MRHRPLRSVGSAAAKTAVDRDHLAGQEPGVRRGQETRDAGDVFGRAPSLQQRLAAGSLLPVSEACSPHAVLIQPGARQLTRTSGASERAKLRVNAATAPFTAPNISPLSPPMPCSA